MKITRRNFVQALGTTMAITVSGAGVKSAFGLATSEAVSNASAASGLFRMSADGLKKFVGRRFVASSSDGRHFELIMSEVTSAGRRENRAYSGECFSVVFKSRGKQDLAQGVYEIESAEFDRFSALIVPTGRHRREFEMVVNQLTR